MTLSPTIFDPNVLAIHEPGFLQTPQELARDVRCHVVRRQGVEESDYRHPLLLRTRGERPRRRRAAQECDEVAPSHVNLARGQSLSKGSVVRHNKIGSQTTMRVTPGPPPWPSHVPLRPGADMVSAADGSRTVKTEDKQIAEAEQRQREREEREAAEARKAQEADRQRITPSRDGRMMETSPQRRSSSPSRMSAVDRVGRQARRGAAFAPRDAGGMRRPLSPTAGIPSRTSWPAQC